MPPRVGGRMIRRRIDGDRQPQRAAHRPAQRLPAERVGGAARRDDAARAAGFRDAHDRADIARILHVGGDDDERRPGRVDAFDVGRRPLGEGDDRARRAHRADRLHHRRGRGGDVDAASGDRVDDRADVIRSSSASAARSRADAERRRRAPRRPDARRRAATSSGRLAARAVAIAGDERVLTAGDALHHRGASRTQEE